MKKLFTATALLLALLMPLALKWHLQKKRTLFVYMWSDYIKTSLLREFEKRYNCRVIVDTYDSNESMYTKLKLGGGGYDVIFPSNYFLDLMIEQEMLSPVPALQNATQIDQSLLNRFNLPPTKWAVPYMVSFSGIAWRKDLIKKPPLSWGAFGRSRFKGRMTMLNDPRETIGAALRFLGFSANTTSKEQITQARNLLCLWKKEIAKLESEQYKNGIASAEYLLAHAYNGDALQLHEDNEQIQFTYPKEGSLVSVDYAAILKTSSDPELAALFIDFLHEPAVAKENILFTNYRCINKGAREMLPEHIQNSLFLFPELDHNNTFECLHNVGPARKLYLEAWDIVRAN